MTHRGKPVSVIIPIQHYQELLERAEDTEAIAWLKRARRVPGAESSPGPARRTRPARPGAKAIDKEAPREKQTPGDSPGSFNQS